MAGTIRRDAARSSPGASPLPVLVMRRGNVGDRALGALLRDPRVEPIAVDGRQTNWVSIAQRAAAVFVATDADPLSALLYVLTAGVTTPIIVAAPRRFMQYRRALIGAGAVACLSTPIRTADIRRTVRLLTTNSGGIRVDCALRLVLDPVGRMVRLREKSTHLSEREFAVLHCLSNRSGQPVPAAELLSYAWSHRPARKQTRQILEVYIFSLRKKLGLLGLTRAIRTVRGYGYALVPGE